MNAVAKEIELQISKHKIIIYMKGSPEFPSCGFSAQAIKIIQACTQNFHYIDVINHPEIRAELPNYANWPTFPQLWINGSLIGGCEIITEMFNNGTLQKMINNYKSQDLNNT